MKPVDVVCLCQLYDVHGMFGPHFAEDNPWVRLVKPEDVADPRAIRHALAFSPGPEDFAPYPNLQMVSSVGAGVDALLDHPGLDHEIRISRSIIEDQAKMIACFALYYIAGWQRRMWGYPEQQAREGWAILNLTPPNHFKVGVLGTGKIGGELARALVGLGYQVTGYGSRAREEDGYRVLSGPDGLNAIAAESHAVVNLLPLTDETRGVLNAGFFAQMRADAILVQLGRGGHLVEADLLAALEAGRPA
ncbi:MAG: NAD(P)-dependent oxidoreductase, partial [Pseudomonadota bacterium]